jgi:transcriptional regulator with XRE-family HTH domain
MTSETREALGRAIRVARARKRLSQDDLAKAAGVNQSYISEVEGGDRNPAMGTLERIADALGMNLAQLFEAVEQERERRRPST